MLIKNLIYRRKKFSLCFSDGKVMDFFLINQSRNEIKIDRNETKLKNIRIFVH